MSVNDAEERVTENNWFDRECPHGGAEVFPPVSWWDCVKCLAEFDAEFADVPEWTL